MKLRVLAAAAVAAWSKTAAATTATVLPGVLDQPAEASVSSSASAATSCGGPEWSGPPGVPNPGFIKSAGDRLVSNSATGIPLAVGYTQISVDCVPGTLSLQASVDQTHWKTLTSQHETTTAPAGVGGTCLPGTWSYQGFYATDDATFKGASPQKQLSC